MKLIIFACLAALAAAAPQLREDYRPEYRHIAILRDDREDLGDGRFRYEFETENGIVTQAEGYPGTQGQSNIRGFFRFPLPDGTIGEVQYVADELGYQPVSNLIPTPHPLPAHAIEQIRFAEEQRAAGVTWDQYGFRLTR